MVRRTLGRDDGYLLWLACIGVFRWRMLGMMAGKTRRSTRFKTLGVSPVNFWLCTRSG